MKTSSRNILAIIILMHCFGDVGSDENSVQLYPSPDAEVEEGETLYLQCSCIGSTPNYINWYLNNDTFGLVIEASKCSYQIKPKFYEIDRYSISCNNTTFNLSIANISKSKDDGTTWKCDITVIGMNPPNKASTQIIVKDKKDGKSSELEIGLVVTVGVSGGLLLVSLVVGYLICRKRKTDGMTGQADGDDTESPLSEQPDADKLEHVK